jgi:hypothetical protein
MRVHAADLQLTFNCSTWIAQNLSVEEWWPIGGVALAAAFQAWALGDFPSRFSEPVKHTSLTIEESLHAAAPQVHLHAQFTFRSRVDRTGLDDFCFGPHRPHVEVNHARGKDVETSRARAHFYVYCSKRGTLWSFTDWWPFVEYEVNPHWLTAWWSLDKLSHQQYRCYLLRCRRSFKGLTANLDAVTAAEQQDAMEDFQDSVRQRLDGTKLPFRSVNDPLFPRLRGFMEQFAYAAERYRIYALQGPSQAAKTSFAKSLFKRPFIVTVQGQEDLDLRAFRYGHHDALILDNLISFDLILKFRALLQSNTDMHRLGQSQTGVCAYSVYLWATPVFVTLDMDVDTSPVQSSDWLRENVLLDTLPPGAKCYMAGDRARIPMSDMPVLRLARAS